VSDDNSSDESEKSPLYYFKNSTGGGQTARLLYTVDGLSVTFGESTSETLDSTDTTSESEVSLQSDEDSRVQIYENYNKAFNLYLAGDGQDILSAIVAANSSAIISFTLYYTSDMSDYEAYAKSVVANETYLKKVQDFLGSYNDTKDKTTEEIEKIAKDYLDDVTAKETELLSSKEEIDFLFNPQFEVEQLARKDYS
jgi:hypothetical protein